MFLVYHRLHHRRARNMAQVGDAAYYAQMQADQVYFDDEDFAIEDKLGMRVTSGKCMLRKADNKMIGISIGGGAPNCPCLFVVQVFDKTPASAEGSLKAGDEIVSINSFNVKGMKRQDVVRLIRDGSTEVSILYNKLHADTKKGKDIDHAVKKLKHKLVERLNADTADVLGLSRAIIANDLLAKKIDELNGLQSFVEEMITQMSVMFRTYAFLSRTQRKIGESFAALAIRERQQHCVSAFQKFADIHRTHLAKYAIGMLQKMRPMFHSLVTFRRTAFPDMKETIRKYMNKKFEYLSYCLKINELDEEEKLHYHHLSETLYRVETGNYEYRLLLRCREHARMEFLKLRRDVFQKLELLHKKLIEIVANELKHFVLIMHEYHQACYDTTLLLDGVFPLEIVVPEDLFTYSSNATSIKCGKCDELHARGVEYCSTDETAAADSLSSDDDELNTGADAENRGGAADITVPCAETSSELIDLCTNSYDEAKNNFVGDGKNAFDLLASKTNLHEAESILEFDWVTRDAAVISDAVSDKTLQPKNKAATVVSTDTMLLDMD